MRACLARRPRSSAPAPARPCDLGGDRREALLELGAAPLGLGLRLRERVADHLLVTVEGGELV
ncbi:MAG: hypothetical protein ACRDN6_13610, partial [Gaiellaceae bacterium]